MTDPTWFLIQTKHQLEAYASESLERKRFVTYAPMRTVVIWPQNRKRTVARPLLPGYLFVREAPENPHLSEIRKTYGVAWIVESGTQPVRVPNKTVADLKAAEDAGLFDETRPKPKAETDLKPGEKVEVVYERIGAFATELLAVNPVQRVAVVLAWGKRLKVPLASVKRVA